MRRFIAMIIAVTILGAQHILSKQKSAAFGGILPAIASAFSIWFIWLQSGSFNKDSIFPCLVLICILCGVWIQGRLEFKKQANKQIEEEIEKMRAKDL